MATDDSRLAEQIRLQRNFGFAGFDKVISIGTNAKMNEVSAAMGLTLMDDLDEIIAINRRNYEIYSNELNSLPGCNMVKFNLVEKNNYQYIVLEIDPQAAGITRDQLTQILWTENIRVRRYFFPGVHRMEPYRTQFPDFSGRLPETEKLVERLITLPTGTTIRPVDIEEVCQIIRLALRNSRELKQWLERSSGDHP